MITSLFVVFAYFIIIIPFGILPNGIGFPDIFHQAAIYLNNNIFFLNPLLPIDTIVYLTAWSITISLLALAFRIIMWIVSFIRGSSTPT